MRSFKSLNNLVGWLVFAIAFATYLLTLEPTASFWDCGEFIACAYKLLVPHPPGAPTFLLLGRVLSLFSFGDVTKVAILINALSALSSAFTVLFLFWIITHLGRKLLAAPRFNNGPAGGLPSGPDHRRYRCWPRPAWIQFCSGRGRGRRAGVCLLRLVLVQRRRRRSVRYVGAVHGGRGLDYAEVGSPRRRS
jgi:hypothetical protein